MDLISGGRARDVRTLWREGGREAWREGNSWERWREEEEYRKGD